MIPALQTAIFIIFYVAIFGASVWALLDLLRRPTAAFTAAGKLTKAKWGGILGLSVAASFMALPYPIGLGFLPFLALGAAVAAIVYLVDVKPAVTPYTKRRGPRGPQRGGW
ncbi:DUF2516 family protein [Cellulomonas cellasea]|uniref:DUF2516 family protein n=1 Tax=Cellulomonas cellasea TaxID=43670 RepID=UPI0025A3885E|nr:DUF2516 family protein [Cellulomonas cellasea]MDM8086237.1 DUF2516 family protein [Cellulomonas cellasea]